MNFISLVFPTLFLLCIKVSSEEIGKLIEDVTVEDKFYFNDLWPEEYYGIAILQDGRVNITFKVGQGFRGQVIEDEAELLQDRVNSLNKSGIEMKVTWKDGRTCLLGIHTEQLVRNYIRFYRMTKEVAADRPNFIKIIAKVGESNKKVAISLLQTVSKSVESAFKYLPYQINHFPDLFQFTVSQDLQERYFINFELTISEGCLPKDALDIPKTNNNNLNSPASINEGNGSQSDQNINQKYSIPQNVANNCDSELDIPGGITTCYDVLDDLSQSLGHLYMMAVQMQHIFFLRFQGTDADDDDTEVCAVTLSADTASSTKTNFEHTMRECCNVILDRQQLFRAGEMKQGWQCHDPYFFSRLLLECLSYFSVLLVFLVPMSIKMLPTTHERAEGSETELQMNEEKVTGSLDHAMKSSDSISAEPNTEHLKGIGYIDSNPGATPETQSLSNSIQEEEENGEVFSKRLDQNEEETKPPPAYELVFVDDDPVYRFGANNLLWFLLLFNVKNPYVTVARRLLFLYVMWLLHYLAALQMFIFYMNIYLYKWQTKIPSLLTFLIYSPFVAHEKESDFHTMLVVYFLIVPLILAVAQFIFLSPLLTNPESLAKVLYWEEHDSSLGSFMGVDLRDNVYDFNLPYEDRVAKNFSARLSYLVKLKFWKYLYLYALFDLKKHGDGFHQLPFVRSLVKLLLMPFIWPFYTLPIFTAFRNFFADQKVNGEKKKIRLSWMKKVLLAIGIVSLIFLWLPSIFIYLCMLLYFIVDVFRNVNTTLTQVIFLISVLGNIRESFCALEDEYRTVKAAMFNIIESFAESESDEKKEFHDNVMWESPRGDVCIPKVLFEEVCNIYLPFSEQVVEVLGNLIRNMIFIGFLYALIVDYQIFDELSETGESVITVIFVSLPSLLSREKSDASNELEGKERENKLEVLVMEVLHSPQFWHKLKGNTSKVDISKITTV